MATGNDNNFYVDPWQEYRAVQGKMKKRFLLRKPKPIEVSRDFVNLANRLKEEECSNYAGLCHLAVARNNPGDTSSLKNAARFFMETEMDKKKTNAPSFGNNLNMAVHCYSHAVKGHVDQKQPGQAANLCLELGINLMKINRSFEAIEYFEKAVKYSKNQPINEAHALEWLSAAQVTNGEKNNALKTLRSLKEISLSCCEDKLKPTGVWRRYLIDAEITAILLITAVGPQRLNEDEANLRRKYVTATDAAPETYLDADCFSLLQCFVLAAEENDYESCDVCLTNLRPFLKPFVLDLAISIVNSLKNCQIFD